MKDSFDIRKQLVHIQPMNKTKLNLVEVVEGSLWRSESGNTRVSHPCSQWFVTVKRFIGGDETESFNSKAALLRWFKKNNTTVNFPKG